jgi:hypothetical protein
MENLTAFVRERSRRNETERTSRDLEPGVSVKQDEFVEPPATDIAAVLTVIMRRSEPLGPAWQLGLAGRLADPGEVRPCPVRNSASWRNLLNNHNRYLNHSHRDQLNSPIGGPQVPAESTVAGVCEIREQNLYQLL